MGKNPRTTKIEKMTLKEESSDTNSSENSTPDESNSPQNEAIDYEKQRKLRIAENNARMEAMGLHRIANSLMKLGGKRKKVVKTGKEDDEYQPSDYDDDDELRDDDSDCSSSEEFGKRKSKKKKGKKEKVSATIQKVRDRKLKSGKQVSLQKQLENTELMDEDNALKQAIALSLSDIGQYSDLQRPGLSLSRSSNHQAATASPNEKRKNKIFKSRVQMTEDDVVINFCQFDEVGKGSITFSDLKRMADSHDFTWSDKQLAEMIRCFDSDRDGKLSMDDFRNVVLRCNMLQVPEIA